MPANVQHATDEATWTSAPLQEWDVARPTSASQLMEESRNVGGLRGEARTVHAMRSDEHHEALYREWSARSVARGKAAPVAMLDDVADIGFAWRDVARMLGVSVPAVQKWRRGEGVTGANRRRIASLLAMCDMLAEHYDVQETGSWFEMPLLADCPLTPIDLYAGDRPDLVFDYASAHVDPQQVLSDFEPDWRETYRSAYEVYQAADGELAIRAKASGA